MRKLFSLFTFLLLFLLGTNVKSQDCVNCEQINPNQPCILIYDPVCGCDGITYPNDCVAFYNGGVTSWVSGTCVQSCIDPNLIDPNANCSSDTSYVCGCDGVTYLNECEAVNYGGLTLWTSGPCNFDCVDCDQIDLDISCPAVWDPVCGCNGVTYGNDCEAFNWGGVTSWTPGECGGTEPVDEDGDGFDDTIDCNDMNPNIYPGAPELCNGFDDDCDSEIDEGLPIFTYFLDFDGDNFGNINQPINNCETSAPTGYVADGTDCDDNNTDIYPGATEIPNNGIDEDCDGFDLIVGLDELFAGSFKVYPNPTKGNVWVESLLPTDKFYLLTISNALGEKIDQFELMGKAQLLKLNQLDSGFYFLTFSDDTFSHTMRIIIIR